jgi:DNA-binding ferritin-like protein
MSTQTSVRRQAGSIEESEALRLGEDKAEQIVDALNTDLAATYVLYHQVKKHHWNVEGAEFLGIHEYLGEVAADLEEGADMLAERAQAIGGVPLSGGSTVEEHAHHLEHYLEDDTLVLESATK